MYLQFTFNKPSPRLHHVFLQGPARPPSCLPILALFLLTSSPTAPPSTIHPPHCTFSCWLSALLFFSLPLYNSSSHTFAVEGTLVFSIVFDLWMRKATSHSSLLNCFTLSPSLPWQLQPLLNHGNSCNFASTRISPHFIFPPKPTSTC